MYKPEMRSNMLAFQAIFSFDLRTQLHGVTVYNAGAGAKDGIFIVYADFNPDQVIGLLKSTQSANATTNRQHVIYDWVDAKNAADTPRSYATIERGFMVVGKDRERLGAALDIIDGNAPRLSDRTTLPELEPAGQNTFVQATARKLDLPGSDPNVALLKMARRVQLRANEMDEQLDAALTVDVGDETTAKQMSVVAQGLVALLSLQKAQPKAAALADKFSVKESEGTVTVNLAVPSADLIAAMKAYTARK
jgi:hypothetical protein